MYNLFPPIKPYVTHTLATEDPHVLYVEEAGNPRGIPVVVLHGGPGAGCEPYQRQFFDADDYRIVLFDQRGSGRSTPHAELAGNNTQALVQDMERIRVHLNIDRWVIFGGSWGSTLALVYAQSHAQRVLGLILRGIFLARQEDIDWFYQDGARQFFPDRWKEFAELIAPEERDDLLTAYHRRLTGGDEVGRMAAAKAWALWEARTATLVERQDLVDRFSEPYTALSLARLEAHYFVNHCFLQKDQILRDMTRLEGIPGTIVHGRYDVICPPAAAWSLHQAWPGSELQLVSDAGHAATEPGIASALVRAGILLAERLK